MGSSLQGTSGFRLVFVDGEGASDSLADSGANYNRLISDDRADPISGSIGLRSSACEISPINSTGKRAQDNFEVASRQK
jgi:hypothetical protein